ncbi:antibiotic biosynthesis monooxygenase [Gammaproteobacteria bacterium]|nr:antibiotic biosynthesis monooxygenase [Gammaproteobacteria bacterium]
MTVSVLLEGVLKEGQVEKFTELCKKAYKVTRAYDGCQGINLTLNVENNNNFVMTETWESKEHYEKYLAFRNEDGTVELIGSVCDEGPSIRIFDITEA